MFSLRSLTRELETTGLEFWFRYFPRFSINHFECSSLQSIWRLVALRNFFFFFFLTWCLWQRKKHICHLLSALAWEQSYTPDTFSISLHLCAASRGTFAERIWVWHQGPRFTRGGSASLECSLLWPSFFCGHRGKGHWQLQLSWPCKLSPTWEDIGSEKPHVGFRVWPRHSLCLSPGI